ncbi:MAG: hypothetical protein ACQ9ET_00730 [Nitrosomonadaceae bacterium]
MAVYDITTLKANITALAATHTESAYKGILTDIVDSLNSISTGQGKVEVLGSVALGTNRDTDVNHALSADVVQVWVDTGSTKVNINYTIIDSDNFTIHWPATGGTFNIYVQIY